METYYNQKDLDKFSEMAEGAPKLWAKFSQWYGAVLKPEH